MNGFYSRIYIECCFGFQIEDIRDGGQNTGVLFFSLTNVVKAVHRQFRKLTKTKGAFPNENSLLKLLYAGILHTSEKWTMPIHNWSQTLSQLAIYFKGRLDSVLDI